MSNVPEKPNAPVPARKPDRNASHAAKGARSMVEVIAALEKLERETLGRGRKPDRANHATNAAPSMAEVLAKLDKLAGEKPAPARKPDWREDEIMAIVRGMEDVMARFHNLVRVSGCLADEREVERRLDELRAAAAKAVGYKTWAAFVEDRSRRWLPS